MEFGILTMYLLLLIATLALAEDDPATDQVVYYRKNHTVPVGIITTSNGAVISYNEATTTLNTKLINNVFFMETITHLVRERTPERFVHAKGSGAFGYFEVTKDISEICKADFLSEVGKRTPIVVRFSPTTGERGFPELNRDTRGFAIKFYTKCGNYDLVCFNTEMYLYKDPLIFHPFVHALRRNPSTNLVDPKTLWDVITLNPISMHMFLVIFSDRGIPASYRTMPGFGNHLFQVENKDGKSSFVKFHVLPDAGIKSFSSEEARNISATDPDYLTRDLYRAIANGDYPSWTLYAQILCEDDVKNMGPRAFDATRTISTKDFPLQEIGVLVLNRNPVNFFAEIEQLAYCPAHLVPGILGSPDKLFESRRLAYKDAHMYRLGVNANKIPVNCPYRVETHTYFRDGVPPVNNNDRDGPNYYPNSFHGPVPTMDNKTSLIDIVESNEVDNFDQASDYFIALDDDEKVRLVNNVVASLSLATEDVQERAVYLFRTINEDLGNNISEGLLLASNSTNAK